MAQAVAARLETRLRTVYGPEWLQAVNGKQLAAGRPPAADLSDYDLCLAVLAYDPACDQWADDEWRRQAKDLLAMAESAARGKRVSAWDANRAVLTAHRFAAWDSTLGPAWTRAADDWRRLARRLVDAKEWDQATEATSRWLQVDPASEQARDLYVHSLFMGGRHEAVVTVLVDHSWTESAAIDRKWRARRLMTAARSLSRLARHAEAVATATRVLQLDESLSDAWRIQARSLLQLGQFEGAIASARRALRDDSQQFDAWSTLVDALHEAGRPDDALTTVEEWIAAVPEPGAWERKAEILMAMGRYQEARQAAELLVTLEPDSQGARGLAALACSRCKDISTTLAHAERWIEIGPDPTLAEQELRSFRLCIVERRMDDATAALERLVRSMNARAPWAPAAQDDEPPRPVGDDGQ